MEEKATQKWDSGLYDKNYSFVFKYGEDLLNLLDPKSGERILDLGCGTGYLTSIIASTGADVTGMDMSNEMIEEAKKNYPGIKFITGSATDFSFDDKFDSVFSNAVLHWVKEKEKAIKCVYDALKAGGKFIAEFGGKNNIHRVETALRNELKNRGYTENAKVDPWYYPSVAEYTSLLEEAGFTVDFVRYFKRDTILKEGDNITGWIEMFGKTFFHGVEKSEKDKILNAVQERLYETNYKDGKWFVDYIRLRFVATRE